jgi:uncharacterized protein (DUF488 family)
MKLFTIGFTQSTAQHFFARLSAAPVRRLIDVRLNNVSQLAGFAKRDDLKFFLGRLCGIDYCHLPELAPTAAMLGDYRRDRGSWDAYRVCFTQLLTERRIETLDPTLIDGGCLLCSEALPHRCHRRLVAEYLRDQWGGLDIVDL